MLTSLGYGGSSTPAPWGDFYSALKQGVVNDAENNPRSIVSSEHSEVCKYYIPDAHTRIPDLVIISQRVLGNLSKRE
jgi:TRAP-type C4-dicarboxylate transport system substrate-binding protein